MSQNKSTIDNILLSGYLHEHEENVNLEIPNLISAIISVYCKEYKIQTIGLSSPQQSNSQCTTDLLTALNDKSLECNVFRENTTTDSDIRTTKTPFLPITLSKSVQKQIDIIMQNTNDEIIDIQNGAEHKLILTLNGNVYAFGSNDSGQCGLGQDIIYVKTPTQIPFECKIKSIACGKLHSLFINTQGKLLACGYNYCGQLGLPNGYSDPLEMINDNQMGYYSESEESVIDHEADAGYMLSDSDSDDDEWEDEGDTFFTPVENHCFGSLDIRFTHISCGLFHSLCLTANGDCYTFGHNGFGNLGNGSKTEYGEGINIPYKLNLGETKFISGSCGDNHNILLTDNNEMVAFGDNGNNQCSIINDSQIEKPYILSKEKEFGIAENCYIEKIMCVNDGTISIIDMYKRL